MKKKEDTDQRGLVCSAKITYPLMLSLLLGGCSYNGGQFSYFDLTNDNKKLASRQAAEKFWAAVRPKSTLSDAHYRLGLHYQQMGEHEKAIGEFTKALRNDRSYCKAYNGIAMTYDLQKRCEQAHASYEQAANCAPGEAYVYNNYACSSLLCGDYGKGMELLRKAENLAENDTRIKNNLMISRTIAIRENLSGYLMSENLPQLAATEEAPSIAAQESALPDPLPTFPDGNTMSAVFSQDASAMSAENPPESAEIAINSPTLEISPSQPQAAEAVNPSAENKEIVQVSAPALSPPVPVKVAIEVSNGNGTTGMAKRSADFLRNHGFTVRSITNAKNFRFEESVIYYKEGYLQSAKNLAAVIPGAQNLEEVDALTKSFIGIRVLLGRDLVSMHFPEEYTGLAEYKTEQLQSAVLTASNDKGHF